MMPREGIDDSVMAGLSKLAAAGVTEGVGECNRVLFRESGDQGYGYEAGPQGVELLEFRNATTLSLCFRANPAQRWDQIARVYREREAIWREETVPPS